MRMWQIEILYIFVPYLQEIFFSLKKSSFFRQTKAQLSVMAAQKTDLAVKNDIFQGKFGS